MCVCVCVCVKSWNIIARTDNRLDRGAWWATVLRLTKCWPRLSAHTHTRTTTTTTRQSKGAHLHFICSFCKWQHCTLVKVRKEMYPGDCFNFFWDYQQEILQGPWERLPRELEILAESGEMVHFC